MARAALLVAVAACLLVVAAAASDNFRNVQVKRTIDLTKHIVVVKTKLTITSASGSPSKYSFAVPSADAANMAYITAKGKGKKGKALNVKAEDSPIDNGFQLYTINLGKGLAEGDETKITVTQGFTHRQVPYPAEILQSEKQLVVFEDSAYFSSPYQSDKQTTTLKLASSKVASHSETVPTSLSGDSLTYGPYNNVAPYSKERIRVHFENGYAFATAEWAEREIEVSHWGNVAVEEHYEVVNTGAKLKGGFSRLDFQMKMHTANSFQVFVSHVPFDAVDLYYRDIIGNISTSHVRQGDDYQEMEMEPRFPIFGGWRTNWYQGYNMPLSEMVTVGDDGRNTLSLDFGPTLQHVVFDKVEVKVILPEGASDIEVKSDVPTEQTRSTRYTYFDTPSTGRPVLSLKVSNFVGAADGKLQVSYSMPPMFMLREPLLLVGAYFALFLTYIIVSRIDLSIKA